MIELKIRGNKESYQLTKKVDYLDITLKGQFDTNQNDKIEFKYENNNLFFENSYTLFKFTEEIKGASLDKLVLTFNKYKFNTLFVNDLSNKKTTEIGLLKALFLIYNWIGLLLSPFDANLKKQLYNEFVVDYSNQPESQKDIYFIEEKHTTTNNSALIQKLIDLNLLASFTLQKNETNLFISYFIPLVKPGVSRNNFITEFDQTGDKTYHLWKSILKDRDIKITNWINNRF